MAMEGVAEKVARKYKPSVNIGVSVDTRDMGPTAVGSRGPKDWRKEEMQRVRAEIGALQKELDGFDPKEAAAKVRRSLELKLKLKKVRLEELQLKMDAGYDF